MSDDRHLLTGRANGFLFRRADKTASYVVIPPAHVITDSDGAMWTFGFTYNGDSEINVLRNDVDMGVFAAKIEYRRGQVRIFGKAGWRTLSRSRRHFI